MQSLTFVCNPGTLRQSRFRENLGRRFRTHLQARSRAPPFAGLLFRGVAGRRPVARSGTRRTIRREPHPGAGSIAGTRNDWLRATAPQLRRGRPSLWNSGSPRDLRSPQDPRERSRPPRLWLHRAAPAFGTPFGFSTIAGREPARPRISRRRNGPRTASCTTGSPKAVAIGVWPAISTATFSLFRPSEKRSAKSGRLRSRPLANIWPS